MSARPSSGPVFFASAGAFRAWLERHAARAQELIVGFHKVGSGKASLTWPESVDEALCFGWIDGVRRRIDEHAYQIRFTPRRAGSVWSAVNIRRAEALIAGGRMTPAGRAAFERRIERRSRVYLYEQEGTPELTAAELRAFRRQRAAWRYFEACPPGYRRTMVGWIATAKRAETRARRLAKLMASCAAGERLLP